MNQHTRQSIRAKKMRILVHHTQLGTPFAQRNAPVEICGITLNFVA
jgi:hypothetical protein